MNRQKISTTPSGIKKIALIIMSIWSILLGACAQSTFTNVDVNGFEKAIKNDSVQILDVRTSEEFAEGHIKGAIQVDVFSANFLADAESKLKKDRTVAVYCRSGKRSANAAKQLTSKGFKVINLEGGIMAWIANKKETVK